MRNKEIIPYKENIFTRIKNSILKLFGKKQIENNIVQKEEEVAKQELLKIYEGVKKNNDNIDSIDTEQLYKIMLLLNEEINLVNERVNKEIREIEDKIEKISSKMETV